MSDDIPTPKTGPETGNASEPGESQPTPGAPSASGSNPGPDVAIALDYQPLEGGAPIVVAKGQGWLAEQIIAIAEANGIEVKKDPDLAQLLESVDVDSEIPLEAFAAVAEILSYVYRLNDQWPEGMKPEAPKPQTNNAAPKPGADP